MVRQQYENPRKLELTIAFPVLRRVSSTQQAMNASSINQSVMAFAHLIPNADSDHPPGFYIITMKRLLLNVLDSWISFLLVSQSTSYHFDLLDSSLCYNCIIKFSMTCSSLVLDLVNFILYAMPKDRVRQTGR